MRGRFPSGLACWKPPLVSNGRTHKRRSKRWRGYEQVSLGSRPCSRAFRSCRCRPERLAMSPWTLRTGKLAVMSPIQACALPEDALLLKYTRDGAYADCYATEVGRAVSQAQYIEAFYTGALFKLERRLLAWFVSKPSTDAQAKELASGAAGSFAAWRVEERRSDQLLMCDFSGRTRSWLMVAPAGDGSSDCTRLYFGSAVVPVVHPRSGQATASFTFKALLGFHKLYSRSLLSAARSRLARSAGTEHASRTEA
jgi:hypothetical protein